MYANLEVTVAEGAEKTRHSAWKVDYEPGRRPPPAPEPIALGPPLELDAGCDAAALNREASRLAETIAPELPWATDEPHPETFLR